MRKPKGSLAQGQTVLLKHLPQQPPSRAVTLMLTLAMLAVAASLTYVLSTVATRHQHDTGAAELAGPIILCAAISGFITTAAVLWIRSLDHQRAPTALPQGPIDLSEYSNRPSLNAAKKRG